MQKEEEKKTKPNLHLGCFLRKAQVITHLGTQNSTKIKKFDNVYDIADERESEISRYRDVSLIS